MNDTEFRKIIDNHKTRYPGLADFFKRNEGQIGVWREMLDEYDFAEVEDASRELMKQEDQPRGYADHPREMRGIVKRARLKRDVWVDGVKTVRCKLCKDQGTVSCCNPFDVLHVALQMSSTVRSMAFACTCAAGNRRRSDCYPYSDDLMETIKLHGKSGATYEVPFIRFDEVMERMTDGARASTVFAILNERGFSYERPQHGKAESF